MKGWSGSGAVLWEDIQFTFWDDKQCDSREENNVTMKPDDLDDIPSIYCYLYKNDIVKDCKFSFNFLISLTFTNMECIPIFAYSKHYCLHNRVIHEVLFTFIKIYQNECIKIGDFLSIFVSLKIYYWFSRVCGRARLHGRSHHQLRKIHLLSHEELRGPQLQSGQLSKNILVG